MALLGREQELEELDRRIRSHRLVTVVGPGGVGKTSLAEEAVARAASGFELGARRIDLTRVDSPDAVAGALASQLGYESYEALLYSPGEQPALVLVDNCEHLLDAAASAVADLLAACEMPTVVATSRSPLELPGEAIVALAPLAVPPRAHPDPSAFPAVQLFLQRAGEAGAAVSDDDLEVVAELCRRLDGVPLAIELAAARARTMSVGDIAARLLRGLEVLERRHFRGQHRHRSIADTIHWSYELLDESPSCLLQQLSVFAGPFPVDAARAVGAAEACLPADFDHDLDELVYASLVAVDTTGPETRYRLLEAVRSFARERLTSCGGLERSMDAFVDVVLADALAKTRGGAVTWGPQMIGALLDAFDNIAEALRWCNDHDDEPDRALALCGLLWTVVHQGRAEDIVTLARRTVERWRDRPHRRTGAAVATLATAEYVTGHPRAALDIAEPAVAALDPVGSAPVKLHRLIGQARSALGDVDGAVDAFAAGTALARGQGMTAMAIELDIVHAHVRAVAGDPAFDALAAIRTARQEADAIGSPITSAWARTTEGWLLLRSDPARALEVIQGALATSRASAYPIGIVGNLRSLAYAHMLAGELDLARDALSELLDDLLARGALAEIRMLVDASATLAHLGGHADADVLAATARDLPVVSLLLTPGSEPIPLPVSDAAALSRASLIRRTRAVLDDLASTGVATHSAPAPPEVLAPPARFVSAGDVWDVTFDGTTVALRATKGMTDLARLLAAPGQEVHCLDLVGAGAEDASTGEVIDGRARRQYEDRIRELQAEIDDAEDANDLARSERAQEEFDALVDHLTAAMGRGGRIRRGSGSVERARSTVTQRIRASIRRIEEVHPSLGRHLRASIVTGTWCCYRPEKPTAWDTAAPVPSGADLP